MRPVVKAKFQELGLDPLDRGSYNLVHFWGGRQLDKGVLDKACLSQWFFTSFKYKDIVFKTAEHAMMYSKAKLFGDEEMAKEVLLARTPREAKAIGRNVRNFVPSKWDAVKYDIVKEINLCKFGQNKRLKDYLCSFPDGSVFVEASPYDAIYGIKMDADDQRAEHPDVWQGDNLLGFILTEVRHVLNCPDATTLRMVRASTDIISFNLPEQE